MQRTSTLSGRSIYELRPGRYLGNMSKWLRFRQLLFLMHWFSLQTLPVALLRRITSDRLKKKNSGLIQRWFCIPYWCCPRVRAVVLQSYSGALKDMEKGKPPSGENFEQHAGLFILKETCQKYRSTLIHGQELMVWLAGQVNAHQTATTKRRG